MVTIHTQRRYRPYRLVILAVLLLVLTGFGRQLTLLLAEQIDEQPVTTLRTETIAHGKYQATAHIFSTDRPGPVVVVVGGTHGNEPAGHRAALELSRVSWQLRQGRLIILPGLNTPALERAIRFMPGDGDLNRVLVSPDLTGELGRYAGEIMTAFDGWGASVLLDLHEGLRYSRDEYGSVGQSVIFYPSDRSAELALALVEALNAPDTGATVTFGFVSPPVSGSFADAAGRKGAMAFTIETCTLDPLPQRVKEHTVAVTAALRELGMID